MKNYWQYLLLLATAFILYSNTFNNGFVLDDYSAIVENRFVQSGSEGLGDIFTSHYRAGYWASPGDLYRPLVLASFAIEHQISDGTPFIHHFINVLLYALLGVVLYALLQNWFPKQTYQIPLIVTLLFLAHPIHTEVVANIKSRDELMSLFFILSSLLALHSFLKSKKIGSLILLGSLYFLALLSKESSLVFLLIIPATAYFFNDSSKQDLFKIVGTLLVPAIAFLSLRHNALMDQSEVVPVSISFLSNDPVNTFLLAGYHLMLYLYKLVIPINLSSQYPEFSQGATSLESAIGVIGLLFHLALLYFGFKWFKEKKILGFAILFYLFTHFLHSNIVLTIGTLFGERLLFTPSIAFALITGIVFIKYIQPKGNKALMGSALLIGVIYAGITITRNTEWDSNSSLYAADVKKQPNSCMLNYWQSLELTNEEYLNTLTPDQRTDALNEGLTYLEKSLDLNPNYGEALSQMGLVYYKLGQNENALTYYDKALNQGKGGVNMLNNVAAIYFGLGDFEKAKSYYERTVTIDPYHRDAWGNLGITYAQLADFTSAENAFIQAIKINPNNGQLHFYLGMTLNQVGKSEEATEEFKTAFELDPSLRK